MNKKIIIYLLGKILLIEAMLLSIPLFVSFLYKEPVTYKLSFVYTIIILLLMSMITAKKPLDDKIRPIDGIIVTSLGWFLLSFFGGLPFVFSGEIPSFVDAFFETSSGFTTAGSSILTDVEKMSHSHLFWRSFTHLIGGMGVLVFATSILPSSGKNDLDSLYVMQAEVPGPTFGKMVSRMKDNNRILYLMYLVMTAVMILVLVLLGMPIFDAFVHGFGVAGTGGFGIKANSLGFYASPAIYFAMGVGMMVFGTNFNIFYLILKRDFKTILKSDELKLYLKIAFLAMFFIYINLTLTNSYEGLNMPIDIFFQVSSIMSTSGFSTVDFDKWPLFSKFVLIMLMFTGSCSGSTAGGIKINRIGIALKSIHRRIKSIIQPRNVKVINYDGSKLEDSTTNNVLNYLAIYFLIFFILVFLVSLDTEDFITAFSAVACTYNNVGPGFGEVGPMASFAHFSDFTKLLLSFGMIAGRLELYPVIILLTSPFIRKTHL